MSSRAEFAILQSTISVLRTHTVWPNKGQAFKPKASYYITLVLFMLSHLPFGFGTIGHIRLVVKKNHLNLLAEDIAILTSMAGTFYMILIFFFKQKQLAQLYGNLSNFQKFGKPDNFDAVNKKLNLMSYIYGWYCGGGAWIYGAMSLLESSKCKHLNDEFGLGDTCGLFAPASFPFDINYFPAKHIVIFLQAYSSFMLLRSTATISFGIFEVSQHVILRIKHLKRLINEVFEVDIYKERRRNLKFCVKYHIDIIRIYNDFDSCYSSIMGMHITLTGVIFGCILNQLLQEMDLRCILHLTGWLIALYVVCAGGQSLMSESSSIATSLYCAKWHNVEYNLKKDLKLMLLISQKPLYLHASFQVLSLELFVGILKTSYSYMTLLNQTT